MKQLNASEMNAVVGGAWRCSCGAKFSCFQVITMIYHETKHGGLRWCW